MPYSWLSWQNVIKMPQFFQNDLYLMQFQSKIPLLKFLPQNSAMIPSLTICIKSSKMKKLKIWPRQHQWHQRSILCFGRTQVFQNQDTCSCVPSCFKHSYCSSVCILEKRVTWWLLPSTFLLFKKFNIYVYVSICLLIYKLWDMVRPKDQYIWQLSRFFICWDHEMPRAH